MYRGAMILGLVLAVILAGLWLAGGFGTLERLVEQGQRDMQSTLAGAVRRLRAGDPGALAALMAACFSYGFIHAAGPGHGKVLIAGYGVGRRVPLLRLSMLALASSLAQSLVAIALVFAGITALGWTREQMVGVSDKVMAPISYGAILVLGLWLVWRGARKMMQHSRAVMVQGHDHSDAHGHAPDHVHDEHCGHAHGPSLDDAEKVTGFRDAIGLIAGIAMRPCTGALFLLILTWQMDIFAAGVAGVMAMGIGTASVTVAVAVMAVWAREGALASLPGARIAAALPVMELGAGLVVAAVAGQLLLRSL
jgi:nickel/cobalt transporter (NicO) family protein